MTHPDSPDVGPPARAPAGQDTVVVLQAPVQSGLESEPALQAAQWAEHATPRAVPIASAAGTPRERVWRWLTATRPVQVSPLAAIIAAVLLVGAFGLASRNPAADKAALTSPTVPGGDDLRVVRFSIELPTAQHVALVGDFNGWDPTATMLLLRGGEWTVVLPLAPGRHQYAFVVDGVTWIPDPAAALTADADFGSASSVIYVGT
jgi:Glycogen recognition site of AMP-activated protein kinase